MTPHTLFSFDPEAAEVIRRLVADRFRVREHAESCDTAVHFDTFDWRVFRAGQELRVVGVGRERALAWRLSADRPPLRQVVRTVPAFAADLPAGAVRQGLTPCLEMRRLLPRVEVRRRGTSIDLLDDEEKTVARVHVAERTARLPRARAWQELPALVRVEGLRGYDEELAAAAGFLSSELGLIHHRHSELEDAAAVLGLTPGRDPSKPQLRLKKKMRAAPATRAVLGTLLEVVRANEDGLRRDLDSEFLHDFRVALRRARSVLSQIDDVLPPALAAHLEGEVKWLCDVTSPLRDLDVFRLRLPDYEAELPEDARGKLGPLRRHLEARCAAARETVVEALGSPRYRQAIRSWRHLVSGEGEAAEPAALSKERIADVASARIRRRYEKLLSLGLAVGGDTPARDVHRVRIEGKKLRNLLELFRGLYKAKACGRAITTLKRLQTNLGDFNDFEVHEQMLIHNAEEMARDANTPAATLLEVGRLAAQLAARREAERRRFLTRFAAFGTDENQRRYRKLFTEALVDAEVKP